MKNATHISIVLDRSGSMGSIKKDVIGGFNSFLNDQKAVKGDCTLSLVQFDTEGTDTLYEAADIQTVQELTAETYQPRGGTPLLDALGRTIEATGRALENIPETDRPDKVLFVVITDGEENSSHTYTKAQIKQMIETQEKTYNWNFIFLGANQDAFAEAGAMGVTMANAANFRPTRMRVAYAAMSANTVKYRGSGQSADLNWTPTQRSDMDGTTNDVTFVPTSSAAPTKPRLNWKRRK